MSKFDVLIFDLDNTLIDFSKAETLALVEVLKYNNIEINDNTINIYKECNKKAWEGLEKGLYNKDRCVVLRFESFLKNLGLDKNPDKMNQMYLDELSKNVPLIDGAIDLLEKVKNDYIMVMMTNGVKRVQESKLEKSGLNKYFEHILISDDIGYNKPDIRIYEYMEKIIGKFDKSKILMIGDSLTSDIKGADNYGIKTCFFNPKSTEHNNKVDYEIKSLLEILSIL